MAAILGMAAISAWAIGTGRISYTITHGVSMNPVYYQNDLVFVVKSPEYHVGEIAEYRSRTGIEVLHRIIGGDSLNGFVFKGDNNQSTDTLTPTAEQIIGRALLHVPQGGVWLKPILSPTGFGMMGFLIISGGAAGTRTRREIPRGRRKKKVKAMARQGGSWATAAAVVKIVRRLPPLWRAAAALIAAMTVLGIALGVLGWMKPVTKVEKASPGLEQSMTFAYTAKVPRSAAYDGTTVTSPDPIFRKLADKADLRISYHGHRGVFDVRAELTNGSGWHTTLQLLPAKAFSGVSHDATMTLDLDAIDKRATDAATAIGIQPSPVTIAVEARVAAVGQSAFTAPLQLSLTPLELILVNGAGSLTVKDAGASSAATRVMREIEIFGRSIMTAAQARSYAVLLLLAALVGAAAIAFVARRDSPLRTRTEIERRYPQLLVPVEPMASPPGKPVVLVDNFPALVRLAERYGQMILTWRRPDADDFIVRDEGITYRYRVPLDEATLQNIEDIDRPPGAGSHRWPASSEVS
jgi:signal peptidase I